MPDIFKAPSFKPEYSHIFIMHCEPQLDVAEGMNCILIRVILSHIGLYHTNLDRFLEHISYARLMAVRELVGKNFAEIFLSYKDINNMFSKVGRYIRLKICMSRCG